jgi:tetratricopeptide (TPR) repeat protein
LNRTDDALEQLHAGQQLDQARLDIALEIARTLEGAKRDDAATEAYTKLLTAKDVPTQARVHAGRFFARKDDKKRAAEQADPILAAEPENSAGHYLKGEGLILAGKLDDARKELTMAVDRDPDPQYLEAQGRAAEASVIASGDTKYYELALRAYERASQADANLLAPQVGMGRVYVARKEWTKAAVPLAAAIKLDKSNTEVMYNLGLTYKNLGHVSEAVEWLEAATKGKQDADTYWQLAQLYQDANDGKRTESALREATHLGRDKETKSGTKVDWLSEAWYRLGETEYGLHNYPAAKSAFESYVGRNPPTGQQLTEARRLLNSELKSP